MMADGENDNDDDEWRDRRERFCLAVHAEAVVLGKLRLPKCRYFARLQFTFKKDYQASDLMYRCVSCRSLPQSTSLAISDG